MPQITKLSEIASEIDDAISTKFASKTFWVTAEISSVKKIHNKRWCFLDFIEKDANVEICMRGVCWARNYQTIELFENITNIEFKSGIEITCKVSVSFYKAQGKANLEILEIDYAYAVGKLELEKSETLKRLLKEIPTIKYLPDGKYSTKNNRMELPLVIQNVALITSPNSDGQRDFKKVVMQNKYGYAFSITEFLTQVQGNNASTLILEILKNIEIDKEKFDIVVIVRGGGSDTDFHSFNGFELSKCVALFPIPILTGIGHDRNTSIVDLMAMQHRTPTEVGKFVVDHNMDFDFEIEKLKERLFERIEEILEDAKDGIVNYKQRIKNLSPETILKKGFAIIISNNKIVTSPKAIKTNSELQTILKDEIIHSTVTKKSKNEKQLDI